MRHVTEISADRLIDFELARVADLMTAVADAIAPGDPPVSAETARADLHPGDEIVRVRRLLVRDGEDIVGAASIHLDLAGGNQHVADTEIVVHPAHLRQGIGTDLLRAVVTIAHEESRRSLAAWGPRTEAGHAFWERYAMPEVMVNRTNRAAIDEVDRRLLERWRTECAARAEGYDLTTIVGRCPDDLLATYVASQQGIHDAPLDDLDMTQPSIDAAWVRSHERKIAARGGSARAIVATSPQGDPAAMTEILVWRHKPWLVLQQGTTTLAAHRRRGLGRWLKAEMFDQILEYHPEATVIETGNADTNAAMGSINEQMGFRLYVADTIRQADVADVEAALT